MRILLFMGCGHVVESAGGAEKVLCSMANELTLRGHQVTVMCNDIKSGLPFYPLDPKVLFINLDGSGKRKRYPQYKKILRELSRPLRNSSLFPLFPDPVFAQKIKELREPIQRIVNNTDPEIIISYFLDDHDTLVRTVGHSRPLIVMHHGNPDVNFLHKSSSVLHSLRECDCLQVLLPSFERRIRTAYPQLRTACIPNVVVPVTEENRAFPGQNKDEYLITMLGRLEKDKQQHVLICAFAQLAKDYPQWKVHFYGGASTSKYEASLYALIQKFNLGNQVFLKGTTNQPLDVLLKSDIFAFPSAHEGFPLALTEAMSVGLPCIGLKTAPAVNELIIDGYNGLLSENNEADFTQKLKHLMDAPQLRIALGMNGREFVKQFEPKKIWDQWEDLIVETVHNFRRKAEPCA